MTEGAIYPQLGRETGIYGIFESPRSQPTDEGGDPFCSLDGEIPPQNAGWASVATTLQPDPVAWSRPSIDRFSSLPRIGARRR